MYENLLAIPFLEPELLKPLGEDIRAQRKALKISATALAEAAGISRVTLYRIEQGEASVAMGAYAQTLHALGLKFTIAPATTQNKQDIKNFAGWIPARIELARYPALAQLAWQVSSTATLKPLEAWGIYTRNAKHLHMQTLQPHELQLWQALKAAFDDS
ncbi:MAG: helix-turn-helix domain-containing protein [Brachymonas sp.]|nr:helix-turn-helix domain-containing protein [Brachymonas sp.]